MSAIDELLNFLNIVVQDLKKRNEKIPRSLLKLFIYCDKYFKKNKFEIEKFKALFQKCKDDLLKLSEDGYIYFNNEQEKNNFFKKMDDLEKRISKLELPLTSPFSTIYREKIFNLGNLLHIKTGIKILIFCILQWVQERPTGWLCLICENLLG